jgi:hypothetical protein
MITGKTVGGTRLYSEQNCLDRMEALRRYTVGSAWFSNEADNKGAIMPGQLADLAVLSEDYFSIPEEQIKHLESVLTLLGGQVVYAADAFTSLAPPMLPVSPDWSPVKHYGGYARTTDNPIAATLETIHNPLHIGCCVHLPACNRGKFHDLLNQTGSLSDFWGGIGCSCFAF